MSINNSVILKILEDPSFEINRDGRIFRTYLGKRYQVGSRHSEGYLRFRYNGSFVFNHRVIFAKFHGQLDSGMVINHKNGIKTDNDFRNLEQITEKQNYTHSVKVLKNKVLGYRGFGDDNPNRKIMFEKYNNILEDIIVMYEGGKSMRYIASYFKINRLTLKRLLHGPQCPNVNKH
jgi:hypothetical protein